MLLGKMSTLSMGCISSGVSSHASVLEVLGIW
jgi:hypothetical protein